uniref:Uncharacterized protein n=1 Tax=Solanum tuberosum TaxID=4113 RepID=M1DEV7_SOLTU
MRGPLVIIMFLLHVIDIEELYVVPKMMTDLCILYMCAYCVVIVRCICCAYGSSRVILPVLIRSSNTNTSNRGCVLPNKHDSPIRCGQVMTSDKYEVFIMFLRLKPSVFLGTESEDSYDFLVDFHELLHKMDKEVVDFVMVNSDDFAKVATFKKFCKGRLDLQIQAYRTWAYEEEISEAVRGWENGNAGRGAVQPGKEVARQDDMT